MAGGRFLAQCRCLHGEQRVPDAIRPRLWEAKRWARRRLQRAALRRGSADSRREEVAVRYLRGDGIEIGALHRPLWAPNIASLRYVDFLSRDELLRVWSGTYSRARSVVDTGVVDDGERLEEFADASVDFVIANHVLEHIEDPICALHNWVRVVRPNGIIFATLPDARYTFDGARPRTTVEHLLRDQLAGPGVSREEHYREWAHLIEGVPEENVADRIAALARARVQRR